MYVNRPAPRADRCRRAPPAQAQECDAVGTRLEATLLRRTDPREDAGAKLEPLRADDERRRPGERGVHLFLPLARSSCSG